MIITTTIRLFLNAIIGIIELLPQLPSLPELLTNYVNQFMDMIFEFTGLILFFLPPYPILIVLVNFSIALEVFVIGYWLTMWILQKIPFLNIH